MLLMLTQEEMAWFRRLFQGPVKLEPVPGHGTPVGLQTLFDRSWASRDDDGRTFLTREGEETARVSGLAHDWRAALGDDETAQPT
jgi:hypothetical protein